MTGYQEVLSDPSYSGQIVTMTYPLIGNYGVNPEDFECRGVQVAGFIVRESSPTLPTGGADGSLDDFLAPTASWGWRASTPAPSPASAWPGP